MSSSFDPPGFDRTYAQDSKEAYLGQPNLATSFWALFRLGNNEVLKGVIEELFYRLELGETSLDLEVFAQERQLSIDSLCAAFTSSGWLKEGENGLLVYQKPYLQFQSFYHQEKTLARLIKSRLKSRLPKASKAPETKGEIKDFLKDFLTKLPFQPHQKDALLTSLEQKILLLAGLPGSGKSWFLSRLALLFAYLSYSTAQPYSLALAAPTGKATHRLTELYAKAKQDLLASGLFPAGFGDFLNDSHGLFRVDFSTLDKLLQTPLRPYFRLETEPLDYDFVVIDECSMASTSQLYRLAARLAPNTHLLFVGDPYQIPPVKGGNFFAQAYFSLAEKPAYQALTLEFSANLRQEGAQEEQPSQLVRLIRALPKEKLAPSDFETSDSSLVWEKDNKKIVHWQKAWLAWAKALAETRDLEELKHQIESQAILCFRAEGDLGARTINQKILAELRPLLGLKKIEPFHGMPFILEKNDYSLGVKNGDRGVFFQPAGSSRLQAVVFREELETTGAEGKDPSLEIGEIGPFATAYAFSVHKSQGSEYNSIWLLAAEEDSRLNQKALLYTGLSRAKRQVSLLASEKALEKCLRNPIKPLDSLDRFFR